MIGGVVGVLLDFGLPTVLAVLVLYVSHLGVYRLGRFHQARQNVAVVVERATPIAVGMARVADTCLMLPRQRAGEQ